MQQSTAKLPRCWLFGLAHNHNNTPKQSPSGSFHLSTQEVRWSLKEVSLPTQELLPAFRKVFTQYKKMKREKKKKNPHNLSGNSGHTTNAHRRFTMPQILKSNRKFHAHLTSTALKDPFFTPKRACTSLESPA